MRVHKHQPPSPIPNKMVTYSVKAINAILLFVRQVTGRPTCCTLWQLFQEPQECLGKMEHLDHPNEGYAGYMMTYVDYAFYSATKWKDLSDVGIYFLVPTTAITDTDHKS